MDELRFRLCWKVEKQRLEKKQAAILAAAAASKTKKGKKKKVKEAVAEIEEEETKLAPVLDNSLGWGSFVFLSSNARYQTVNFVEERILVLIFN